jgi:hypothetical protein
VPDCGVAGNRIVGLPIVRHSIFSTASYKRGEIRRSAGEAGVVPVRFKRAAKKFGAFTTVSANITPQRLFLFDQATERRVYFCRVDF